MAKLTFKKAFEMSKDKNPGWGTYIHICNILQESGCKRTEILKIFNQYMPKDEYDKPEKGEYIDNLVKISNPIVK